MELKWKLGDLAYFSHEGVIYRKVIIQGSYKLTKKDKLVGTFVLSPSRDSSRGEYEVKEECLFKTSEEIREAEYIKINKMLEKFDSKK